MSCLQDLALTNWRNIEQAELQFCPRFNVLSGQNAQGKTSILESIYLLSSSRVLRGTRDVEAIRDGAETAIVRGEVEPGPTEVAVTLAHGKRKRALINQMPLPRASDLIGRLPSVCFWSGDLTLATGDPAGRRLMLDTELSQIYPAYLKSFTAYTRALTQRNALLRQAQEQFIANELYEAWEAILIEQGRNLRAIRQAWLEELIPYAEEAHASMAPGERFELAYLQKDDGDLAQLLTQNRGIESARGSTLYGPHRDDLELMVEGRALRQFGSQGQQRTAIISLKLAILKVAQQALRFPPILLLDDIFSDLDEGRRSRLVEEALKTGGQIFVTCTEPEQAGGLLGSDSKIFRVQSGEVAEL